MRARSRRSAPVGLGAALLLGLLPGKSEAHLVESGFGTFYDGVAHLLLTPSDLLLVLGLAGLAGLRGAATARPLLLALPAAWLAGGLLGAWLSAEGGLPGWTAGSVALVGALVAADARVPRGFVVALGAASGALHGLANGSTTGDALPLAGAALASFTIVTLAAALVASRRVPWQRVAVRVAGSWIAAVGLLMLGWQARGPG